MTRKPPLPYWTRPTVTETKSGEFHITSYKVIDTCLTGYGPPRKMPYRIELGNELSEAEAISAFKQVGMVHQIPTALMLMKVDKSHDIHKHRQTHKVTWVLVFESDHDRNAALFNF